MKKRDCFEEIGAGAEGGEGISNKEQGILNDEVRTTKTRRHEETPSHFHIFTSKKYPTRNKEF